MDEKMTSSLCLAHPPSGYGVDYRDMHVGGTEDKFFMQF